MQGLIFPEIKGKKRVAVAVSGGADSMALLHLLDMYASTVNKKLEILALTVDHGLRPESGAEARKVAAWVKKTKCCTHKILKWEGVKPQTGKMESARTARYALMAAECKKQKIKILAVAHHADDQAETFLMRVAHGSGLDGLAGMKRIHPYDAHLTLYRPLLDTSHADLVAYCKKQKIKWIEDKTNKDQRYTRARLRKALTEEGWDAKRLTVTLQRLERAQNALADIALTTEDNAMISKTESQHIFDLKKLKNSPFEIFLRILRTSIEKLGRAQYGPRLEKLEEIAAVFFRVDKKTKTTLGGCILEADPKRAVLKITRERL